MHRPWLVCVICLAPAGAIVGCGDDSTPSSDVGPDGGAVDAQPGPGEDASRADVADANADVVDAADAADAGSPSLLVVGVPTDVSGEILAGSFESGTWSTSALVPPAESNGILSRGGGGVALTGTKRGVVALRGNTNGGFYSAKWTGGTWSTLTRQGAWIDNFIASPASAPGKALVVHQSGSGATAIRFGVIDDASGTWSALDQETNATGNNGSCPAIAARADGSAMVAFAGGTRSNYQFTTNAGGTWLASPSEIPNAPTPLDFPSIELSRRAGSDQVVALLRSGNGKSLRWSSWSGTAWSNAVELASDMKAVDYAPFAITSLSDGRVVLAYSDAAGQIRAGFFDGAVWSALKIIPLSPAATARSARSVALAAGTSPGAVFELVYIDTAREIRHVRLTNEVAWTFTTPALVKAGGQYDSVHLAAGP